MNARQRRLVAIFGSIVCQASIVAFLVAMTLLPRLLGAEAWVWEGFMSLTTFNSTGKALVAIHQTLRIWK